MDLSDCRITQKHWHANGSFVSRKSIEHSAVGLRTPGRYAPFRVRAVQRFLRWLAAAHNVADPVHWRQLVEHLQVRLSELCVRGALKATHRSFLYLQAPRFPTILLAASEDNVISTDATRLLARIVSVASPPVLGDTQVRRSSWYYSD